MTTALPSSRTLLNRARGALLGLAVGDALGTTHEFQDLVAPPFPTLATGPLTEVVGGGPFKVAPGQVTDDSHLAVCLAESLLESGGYDPVDAVRRYQAWAKVTFDIGATTSGSLGLWREGVDPADCGRRTWERSGRRTASNGSLMRTAPIGVYFHDDPAKLREASLQDSRVTHFDPRCQLACAALNAAISQALHNSDAVHCLATAQREVEEAAGELRRDFPELEKPVASAALALLDDLDAAERDDPGLYDKGMHLYDDQGFVRVAFRLAFWELLHAPTYEAALVDAVNRGGDSDTTGAITGALLGAVHGEAAIPARWRNTVLNALLDSPPSPWRDTYHPRRLLRLT